MTKFNFLSLLCVAVLFFSCENEETNVQNPEEPVGDVLLVSQIVESYEGTSETYTVNYTYDGTRLMLEEDSDGYKLSFTYQDDKLVSTLSTNGIDDSENIMDSYFYDEQGRINSITTEISGFGSNTVNLSYSADNSVVESYFSNTNSLVDRLTTSNGNIVKFEEYETEEEPPSFIDEYTYGDMNAPFKNIDLKDVMLKIYSENLPRHFNFDTNNVLTKSEAYPSFPEFDSSSTYSYTFNEAGYPETITEVYSEDGFMETTTYTLTYITAN